MYVKAPLDYAGSSRPRLPKPLEIRLERESRNFAEVVILQKLDIPSLPFGLNPLLDCFTAGEKKIDSCGII